MAKVVVKYENGYTPGKVTKIINTPATEIELNNDSKNIKENLIDWGDDGIELEEFTKSQMRVKKIVGDVLEVSESARGDDLILFLESIKIQYPNIDLYEEDGNVKISIPKQLVRNLKPETYRRWRQKYNEEGEYLPTSVVALRRRKNEKVYKKFFTQEKIKNEKVPL